MNHNYFKTMRSLKAILMGCAILSMSIIAQAQSCMMTPVSLQERVSNSDLVVEGKILAQKSYWNHDKSVIYTVNKIEVYKVFKGVLNTNVISVVTQGGVVGDKMMRVSPSLELVPGEVGMFSTKMSGVVLKDYDPNFHAKAVKSIYGGKAVYNPIPKNETIYEAYGSAQGYVNYDRYQRKAVGVFDSYNDVVNDLYIKVSNVTNRGFFEVKSFVADDYIKQTGAGQRVVNITALTNTAGGGNVASAGTYTEIRITGTGFGANQGELRFPNADDGGATTINCPAGLITTWTDTEIICLVPSGATTGQVQVRHATTGSSTVPIIVPYNVSNIGSGGVENAADMVNTNSIGGYTWTYSTNFYSNKDAVARFGESLCEWTAATGINWDTAATQSTVACQASGDGVNIVSFDNTCALPSGVLGTCYSYYSGCYGASGLSWYVSDLDIKFDAGQNWNFTAGPPAAAEYDFKSVAMHEVGHGHQLGHFALTSDIMYWSLTNGFQNVTIDANATNGGLFVMDRNGTAPGSAAWDDEVAHVGHSGGSFASNECGPGAMIPYTCTAGPSCFDGILNQDETSIDCGGVCQACATKCANGVQDGAETGVDCGGPCTACCTPPPNDSIQFAVSLTTCPTITAGDNTCSTADGFYASGCVTGDHMMWYTVDLTNLQDGFDLTLSNSSSGGDFEIIVVGQYPNNPTAFGAECGAIGIYNFNNLPVDSVYYIGIGSATLDVGTYDVCLTPTGSACVGGAPANDDICSAVALTMDACQATLQTDSCATADYTDGNCIAAGSMSVWYTFTLTAPNNQVAISFDTNTFLGGQVGMMVLDSVCANPTFVWSDCGNANTDTFNLTQLLADTTYYLMVSTPAGSQGDFRLCIEQSFDPCVAAPASNDSICNATVLDFAGTNQACLTGETNQCSFPDYTIGCIDANSNSVWYEFDLTGNASDAEIIFTNTTVTDDTLRVGIIEGSACDTLVAWVYNECINATNDTINLRGLDSTAKYYILVSTEAGNEGNFDICLNQSVDPCFAGGAPANDSLCSSQIIPTDSTCLTSQTNNCANRAETFGGCFNAGNSTVWYRFGLASTANNMVEINISNHTFTGEVDLMLIGVPKSAPGSCDSILTYGLLYGSECQHPDSGTYVFDRLSDTLNYYLAVGSDPLETGDFDICLKEGNIPPGILTGPEQDCSGGIAICNATYTQTESYIGPGLTQELLGNTCIGVNESNSLWFIFTVQTSGAFGFDIATANDYDFALYNISQDGCDGIPGAVPDRCNFCGTTGNTGMDVATSNATIPEEEPGTPGCNKIMNGLDVTAGETFALFVDNYTADNEGFTITFTGASVFDTIPPLLWRGESACGQNAIVVFTDEPIQCASIDLADFDIFNNDDNLNYTAAFDSATGVGCTGEVGQTTNEIWLWHDGSLPSGNYRVTINPSPVLADKCGNIIGEGGYIDIEYVIAKLQLTTSKSFACTPGEEVTITATGLPANEVYILNPGGQVNTTGVFTVNPTETTVYIITSDYAGCLRETSIGVQVVEEIVTSVDPNNVTICSGTTDLIATTTINGLPCQTCTHSWSAGSVNDGSLGWKDTVNLPDGAYTVVASVPEGCLGNTANATINIAGGATATVCEVLYVSPSGVGANSGLTKDQPTTLDSALARALCTSTVIKCAVGDYNYDKFLWVNGFVTIEGGYDATFTTKSSDMSDGNGSRFIRSNVTADDGNVAGTDYSMFKVVGGSEAFRFQDLKIVMPGGSETGAPAGHAVSSQKNNYGINLGSGCTNYDIIRCYIDGGVAAAE